MSRTIELRAEEFDDINEAMSTAAAEGSEVVSVGGRYLVMDKAEAERLKATGVEMAYLYDHQMPSGEWRIVAVPVNG